MDLVGAMKRWPLVESGAILEIEDLSVEFATSRGAFRAVDEVAFRVPRGGTVGVVGESGSGKTVTAMSVLRLLDPNRTRTRGRILFDGQDLLALHPEGLQAVRGAKVGMVFQDPTASLDPSWTIGSQMAEVLRAHGHRDQIRAKCIGLLREVGIPAPEERIDAYPHQLSGGMRQRVMIAIAVALRPALIIADEPTTALDVTIQAQIMTLLKRLQQEHQTSLLLITHDLGLVAETADELVVMYAGRVVERGPAAEVLAGPKHPYTAALLASTPVPGTGVERLTEIKGMVPDLKVLPAGCRFQDRCDFAEGRCRTEEPTLTEEGGRAWRCHFPR